MQEQDVSSSQGKVRLPGLDPEATPVIGLGLGIAGVLLGLRPRLVAWPLALTALAALIYRNPERDTPSTAGTLYAPADGTVVGLTEEYEHRFLHTDALRLSIAVSPLDVPVQRSPVAGTVAYLERGGGEARPLWDIRASAPGEGERQHIGLMAEWGPVLLTLSAGPLARHVGCQLALGDHVEAGERIATVRLGAQVELMVPRDIVEGLPAIGSQLRAGVTAIGRAVPL